MTNKAVLVILFFFISNIFIGGLNRLPRGFKQLSKKEYERAEALFLKEKELSTYSSTIPYGFASIYSQEKSKKYNLEIAYQNILESLAKYNKNNKEDRYEMSILKIKYADYSKLKREIERKIYWGYRKKSTVASLSSYLEKYPKAHNIAEVITYRNQLAFDKVVDLNTAEAYSNFIEQYPESDEAKIAKKKKNSLAYIELLEKEKLVLKQDASIDSLNKLKTEIEFASLKDHSEQQSKFITVLAILGFLAILFVAYLIFSLIKMRKSNNQIKKQKSIIVSKNEHILGSLRYAKHIQDGFLPDHAILDRYFSEHFIFYRPKDIVSGDFYWFAELDNKLIIAAADCTGHGVPGAFMSMVGHTLLNQIVLKENCTKPNDILFRLRKNLIDMLQKDESTKTSEGMDIGLISIDTTTNKMEFAGAYNSLFLIRDGEFTEVKADKQPVAIHFNKTTEPFTNNEMDLQKGDLLYLYSDGFQDQFGGDKNSKYMKKRLKNNLIDLSSSPLNHQNEVLNKEMDNWMGENKATDDMLILGLKV